MLPPTHLRQWPLIHLHPLAQSIPQAAASAHHSAWVAEPVEAQAGACQCQGPSSNWACRTQDVSRGLHGVHTWGLEVNMGCTCYSCALLSVISEAWRVDNNRSLLAPTCITCKVASIAGGMQLNSVPSVAALSNLFLGHIAEVLLQAMQTKKCQALKWHINYLLTM
eukprot:GHRR01036078.1.p1 GENE.GHRR01036078.1~~GHRR01036078.1.p1  ORF type:complete len:166 (+),score=22.97 GHRR01036078.1:348-845(+)